MGTIVSQRIVTGDPTRLNCDAWHKPLVSIIITHFNYSDFIRDAILSVIYQTHENWELVVVDDASSKEHRAQLERILSELSDARIRYLPLSENVGQTLSFFAGLEVTHGDFVCALDPDDRYAPTFIEEALAGHLNPYVICPVLSTDQYLLSRQGLISGGFQTHMKRREWEPQSGHSFRLPWQSANLYFISANVSGWHWGTTSSLMFRRPALNFLRPHKTFPIKNSLDAYIAQGAHLLGGTLFYTKPLIYRMIHERNDWISNNIYSSFQKQERADAIPEGDIALQLAKEALRVNGAPVDIIRSRSPYRRKEPLLIRWKRSIIKRLPFRA